MPVLRYFVFVGGALLALLLVCNAVFPQVPLPATLKSGSDLPTIRIQSERKWPERVVFDTTLPSVAPMQIAKVDAKVDTTQSIAALNDARLGDTQKASPRESFAQMGAAEAKQSATSSAMTSSAKSADLATLKVADATAPKAEPRSESNRPQPKRKVAKVHPSRPMIIVAQQPQPRFGFFDSTW
jgi:hypothetical protein